MSVLNKDKNMFVRDVSERVKKPVFNRFPKGEEKKKFNLPIKGKQSEEERDQPTKKKQAKEKDLSPEKKTEREEKQMTARDSRVKKLQRKVLIFIHQGLAPFIRNLENRDTSSCDGPVRALLVNLI